MRRILLEQLEQAARRADRKHGTMSENKGLQLAILQEELGEASKEFQALEIAMDEGAAHEEYSKYHERYYEELLDLGGALLRVLERCSKQEI